MSNEIVLFSLNDMERMAKAISDSGLFGVSDVPKALSLMLIAQSEGLHPAQAARDYNIIQGKPALKADAMMSRFQRAGGKVRWEKYEDTEVIGVFSHPAGGEIKISWTIERARECQLTSKDVWKKYPRAMLRSRCISEGIRTILPGVICGFYTDDEVEEFAPQKGGGNAKRVDAVVVNNGQPKAEEVKINYIKEKVPEDVNEIASEFRKMTIVLYKKIELGGLDKEEGRREWSLLQDYAREREIEIPVVTLTAFTTLLNS